MAEASPLWKPAPWLEPDQVLATYVPSVRVVLTPTCAQKKRRVHRSSPNMPRNCSRRWKEDAQMTLSRAPSAHELIQSNERQVIYKISAQQEQEQVWTARQRFVPDSEDEEIIPPTATSSSSANTLQFITTPPKLVTSKSEGQASLLPSRRKQMIQKQHSQPTRSITQASRHVYGQRTESLVYTQDTYVTTNEKIVRRCFEELEHNRSCGVLTSSSSHVPSEAAAMALEQGILSSTTYSSSRMMMDEILVSVAQRAKKQLEAASKRQMMEGKWKRIARNKLECQSFESVSKTKDQYSVMVRMDLPCSLREIMSVFSTDNSTEFHRSMEAIFGDQYVYGVNIRTADCASSVGEGDFAMSSRPQARRASVPATWHGYDGPINHYVSPLRSTKLNVNAVSLMQKHHLVWKQRNMTFMDYLEEDIVTKSVTRVIKTMDMQHENLEYSSITMSSPTAASSSQESHSQHHNQHGMNLHQELKGILAGYIIQEDSSEKLTRFFFYATHHHRPSGRHGQTRMPRSAVQLLRAMVNKVCLLETVVLRRRLGYYPLYRLPTCSDEAAMASYCAACYVPFKMLRKKHFCRLCGHYTCRKCSDMQEVEKDVGLVEKHRVCVSCMRRVSYYVFSMCAFPSKIASNVSGNSWTSMQFKQPTESNVEDDDVDPPIMDDLASNDSEPVEVHSNQSGVFAGFVSDFLYGKDKKEDLNCQQEHDPADHRRQHITAKRRQRLQLSINDPNPWTPGPLLDGQNTPKESICILDSFCVSHPLTSPRSRDLPL
ncbi:unnamed protein product [Peronospora belbahrii]|uniref:FYVE-type domain-containing protein n=1 Tax=Peronospora belbahrii TaxID=622444 RepID=A0AAU9KXD6_9STRA|nr:unnamed protein product [Peronospora belbahrii]